jgi:hypothetical protein
MKFWLVGLFVLASATIAVAQDSAPRGEENISPGARQAIHCMYDLMKAAQGAENVTIVISYDREVGYFPVLTYSFIGTSGQRRDVQLPIQNHLQFPNPNLPDQRGFRSYDIGKAFLDGGGPIKQVDLKWELDCRVIGHIVF